MSRKTGKAWIGCSGFSYNHWAKGVFYPAQIPRKRWLEYYAGCFGTVELNVTFYRLPDPETFMGWGQRTPRDFRFTVKGSKFITHVQTLSVGRQVVDQFMERAGLLEDKLGPVLWQLPPGMEADKKKLEGFVNLLAAYHRSRHAFEFRHESWFVEPVYKILREAGMTAVSADMPRKLPEPPDDFPFLYLRKHGPPGCKPYNGAYPGEALEQECNRVAKALGQGRDVYVYFNNDMGGHAPRNAQTLIRMVNKKSKSRKKASTKKTAKKTMKKSAAKKTSKNS